MNTFTTAITDRGIYIYLANTSNCQLEFYGFGFTHFTTGTADNPSASKAIIAYISNLLPAGIYF